MWDGGTVYIVVVDISMSHSILTIVMLCLFLVDFHCDKVFVMDVMLCAGINKDGGGVFKEGGGA